MEKHYQNIKKFLEDSSNYEWFLDSESLIWIDHREYDEDIISYFNEKMENQIEV